MKKYIHYSLIIFIISIFLLSSVFCKDNLFLVGRIIVIDPGHGYLDPGTSYENIYEKDINLNISLYLKEKLESYGATVYMTRDGDYDLSTPNAIYRKKSDFDNRINLINNSKADIYLNFEIDSNIIIVTGMSGSGKTTLAKKLAIKEKYQLIKDY